MRTRVTLAVRLVTRVTRVDIPKTLVTYSNLFSNHEIRASVGF